jgi:hypothetical protein
MSFVSVPQTHRTLRMSKQALPWWRLYCKKRQYEKDEARCFATERLGSCYNPFVGRCVFHQDGKCLRMADRQQKAPLLDA